ncbi:YmaF family protein [Sporolactobacillus sp. KGMB 08714]|uniref:YmaF family protein n=1 Tax=Sporolactobacillus sp. KGMB 08714 TaxID=3064704 RepID=UPI002FBD7C6C
MKMPIYGFMYSSDDSDPLHAHQLFITSWDSGPVHVHPFRGVTSFDAGHAHGYAGTTEPAPSGVPHTHRYFTFTSFDDGHHHEISSITGPAISLPDGRHYHEFKGTTTVNGATPHSHRYAGKTGS